MSRAAQLVGAAVLVGSGFLALLAGPAAATAPAASSEVPDSAVPIGTVTPGPFSSGQVISVVIPANSVLTPGAGIFIVECAAPGGVAPTDPSQCDGETVQGDTILAGSDGSIDYTVTNNTSGYTVYALPDVATLGESPTGTPVCNTTNECVLYIGQNQTDFTQPHFFSQAFYVTPTAGDTGADPGDGTAPAAGPVVSPTTSTVTAAAVAPSPVANGSDPATVTVRLLDSSSDAVPGKTVTLSAESGSSEITPSSAVSGTDGTAVFTVTDSTAQQVIYSATDITDDPTIPITQTATVTFTAPAVSAAHSTIAASPTQVAADGTTASTITVTLRDQGTVSDPVAGQAVIVTPESGSSVVTTVSGTTNAEGIATFSVVDSTNETVTYKATGGGIALTSTASVTFGTVSVSAGTSTVVAAESTAGVGGTLGTSITVTLLTSGSSPVSSKVVSLTSPSSTVDISPSSTATTDANGEATFTVTDSVAEAVVFTATDTTDDPTVQITQTAKVTFTAPAASASGSTISASPSTVPADGSTASVVTVTIRDQFGDPLAGQAVTVQLTDASGNAEAPPQAGTGGSQTPGTTNASGQAAFSLVDTSAETVTVGATDTTGSNLVLTATASVTFTAGGPDPTQSTVTASPSSVPDDGTTASTVTVTLLDHQGNPVAGKSVTLTPSGGSSVVTPTTPTSDTTNSSGAATFSVTDTVSEAVTYSATDTTDTTPLTADVTVTFGNPPPAIADSVLAASATSAPANGSTPVTITALLYDANGDPVVGKTVALDPQGGNSKVTTVSGVTNQLGQATFTATDTSPETVTYTATDVSDNLPITGESVVVTFTASTTSAAASATAATGTGGSTTAPTTPPTGSSPSQAGTGGVQASTAADTGTVGGSGQLALTGTPSLLPWLLGFGLFLLFGGSLGRRLLRTGT